MVTAIILAGGLGTRLAPILPHLPKALAPIQGTPFLQLLLDQLEASGIVRQAIFALGHKAPSIQEFLEHRRAPFPLDVSLESTPLGTGGALLHALPLAQKSTLLVMNGDSYSDLSLSDFLAFHHAHNADLSLACRHVEDTRRYGRLAIDPSQRITHFSEKSPHLQAGWVSTGLYLFQRALLTPLPSGACSLENDLFPHFLAQNIFAYPHQGTFIDIGIPPSYAEAQELLKPWIPQ